jgi:hypothetical protein
MKYKIIEQKVSLINNELVSIKVINPQYKKKTISFKNKSYRSSIGARFIAKDRGLIVETGDYCGDVYFDKRNKETQH